MSDPKELHEIRYEVGLKATRAQIERIAGRAVDTDYPNETAYIKACRQWLKDNPEIPPMPEGVNYFLDCAGRMWTRLLSGKLTLKAGYDGREWRHVVIEHGPLTPLVPGDPIGTES